MPNYQSLVTSAPAIPQNSAENGASTFYTKSVLFCLEVDGKREDVKAAIKWLEKIGVNVEPVEISVIES